MKLRTRLIIIFSTIIVIALVFLGLVIYKNAERILTQNTLKNLRTLAVMIEGQVTDVYLRYQDHLRIASKRLLIYQSLEDYLTDPNPEHKAKLDVLVHRFEPVAAGLEEMYIFDKKGNIIIGSDGAWEGKNVIEQPFFKKAIHAEYFGFNKKNIMDKYASQFVLATAIKPQDEVLGVVLIVLKSDILSRITRTALQLGASEDILLAMRDSDGNAQFIAQRQFQDDAKALTIIPKERKDIPIIQALDGKDMLIDRGIDYRGEIVMAATRYIDVLGIGIVIKVDRSEFLKPINELNKVVIIFGSIIIFFTLLMAYIVGRSLAIPIELLSHHADSISSGDYTARLVVDGMEDEDEIGKLSKSLVQMSQKLIVSNKNLEKDVQERTTQLQQRLTELEKFTAMSTGREVRMIELKRQINQLSKQLNIKEPYDLSFLNEKSS